MKLQIVLILIFFVSIQLFAGSIDIEKQGVKGGLNFCNMSFESESGDQLTKLMIGTYSTYKSKSFISVQPEGYVTWKGCEVDSTLFDLSAIGADTGTFNLVYLDAGLLGRINLSNQSNLQPYILVGPYVGIRLKSTLNSIKILNLRPFEFGGVTAIGLKIDKFSIEYRFTTGFTSILKGGGSIKNSASSVLIGYEIEKKSQF